LKAGLEARIIEDIGARRAVSTRGKRRERSIKARPRPKFPVRKPGVKARSITMEKEPIVC
jgi:hypothetical protein